MRNHNLEYLKAHILPLSVSPHWEIARREWTFTAAEISEDAESCPCSQYPIYELCHIANLRNGNETVVGNVCVSRFIGLDTQPVFSAIRRIRNDIERPLGEAAVAFFSERRVLTEWEQGFLLNTRRKRHLSARQMEIRLRINRKILRHVGRGGGFRGESA